SLHFCFQRRLYGRRQKFLPVLRVSLVFLRCDAWRSRLQQFASAFCFLGTGRPCFVFVDWFLDRTPKRGGGGEEGIHHDPSGRYGILSWNPLALSQERHAVVLQQWRWLFGNSQLPRRERYLYRSVDFLRRGRQIRTIPAPCLVAGRNGGPDA